MVRKSFDVGKWLVAIVACVAVVALAGILNKSNIFNNPGKDSNSFTGNIIKQTIMNSANTSIIEPRQAQFAIKQPKLQPAYVYIMPDYQSVKKGSEVVVNVNVAGVFDLYAFQFDIIYDSKVLELAQKKAGDWLSNDNQTRIYCLPGENYKGRIEDIACTRIGIKGGINGSGVLETLIFKTISKGESQIMLYDVKLLDFNSDKIYSSVINGRIKVN